MGQPSIWPIFFHKLYQNQDILARGCAFLAPPLTFANHLCGGFVPQWTSDDVTRWGNVNPLVSVCIRRGTIILFIMSVVTIYGNEKIVFCQTELGKYVSCINHMFNLWMNLTLQSAFLHTLHGVKYDIGPTSLATITASVHLHTLVYLDYSGGCTVNYSKHACKAVMESNASISYDCISNVIDLRSQFSPNRLWWYISLV